MTQCQAHLDKMQIQINSFTTIDITQYEKWNIDQIIAWVGSLENHRFEKYLSQIRNGFTNREIRGSDLVDLTEEHLSKICGINNFGDGRDLERHFKSLKSNKEVDEGGMDAPPAYEAVAEGVGITNNDGNVYQ